MKTSHQHYLDFVNSSYFQYRYSGNKIINKQILNLLTHLELSKEILDPFYFFTKHLDVKGETFKNSEIKNTFRVAKNQIFKDIDENTQSYFKDTSVNDLNFSIIKKNKIKISVDYRYKIDSYRIDDINHNFLNRMYNANQKRNIIYNIFNKINKTINKNQMSTENAHISYFDQSISWMNDVKEELSDNPFSQYIYELFDEIDNFINNNSRDNFDGIAIVIKHWGVITHYIKYIQDKKSGICCCEHELYYTFLYLQFISKNGFPIEYIYKNILKIIDFNNNSVLKYANQNSTLNYLKILINKDNRKTFNNILNFNKTIVTFRGIIESFINESIGSKNSMTLDINHPLQSYLDNKITHISKGQNSREIIIVDINNKNLEMDYFPFPIILIILSIFNKNNLTL